ncbi:aldo/keto reductase [Enterococcus gilvus]|uniref:aldo/keto reductase n=1 Tax=Enterococcus gilvus TaxID=160453 RepID=UPI002910CCED|nr:aldo/keto reductase [Enterococcus gilvus]MDU5510067.1 aldo/keto reductase [Enterococcus gilvus]
MKKRTLGQQKLEVSELGYGCMGLNHHRGPAKEPKEMARVVQEAFHQGVTMFDTAEVYGPYTNEILVGEAVKDFRKDIVLATKGGFKIDGQSNFPDSSKKTLRASLEGSLKRLQTDYIDLYYIHRVDPHTPIEEVAETIQQFRKEGKIRHWGLSEASGDTIRKAHAIEPLTAIQSEYSIWWRALETDIFPILEELGIGLVAYSPLGRGFLTGTMTKESIANENDNRAELPRFTQEAMAANQGVLDLIYEIAKKKEATSAQIAIAWILAQREWIVPIPGTTNSNRLTENNQASTIAFTKEELSQMNQAVAALTIVGDRYPQSEKERTGK